MVLCCILNFGEGSKALKLAKEFGAMGGTVFLGRGTVRTEWLNKLGIVDVRKEIFVTAVKKNWEDVFYNELVGRFGLNTPRKGIAFSMPLKYCLRADSSKWESNLGEKDVTNLSYQSIFVIVDKGLASEVLKAAESAGSTGGTVIHGRGSGTQEKAKLFNIEIEPEKDIVLILSQAKRTENIVNAIAEKLNIHEPNAGVVFVMEVTRTLGLYQG